MTVFIGSDNVSQMAKVQSAASFGSRDRVVLLWDELSEKERSVAEHIGIDVEVHTSDPDSVPTRWADSIVKEDPEGMGHIDIVKRLASDPDRLGCYEMLVDEEPPVPLMLWWLEHVFNDEQFAKLLSDVCHHALFQIDHEVIYGVMAFGGDPRYAKFSWPEASGDEIPPEDEELFEEAMEKMEVPEKGLRIAWSDVRGEVDGWISDDESDEVGGEPEGTGDGRPNLLDF